MPVSSTVKGIKESQFEISGLPKIFVIGAWKIKTIRSATKLTTKAIIVESAAILIASSSFSGSIIVSSYLPFDRTATKAAKAKKSAMMPKSFGVYILVKIGEIRIGIIWAIVVPVIKVNTFSTNDPSVAE